MPPRSLSPARRGHGSGSPTRWSACSPAPPRSAAGSKAYHWDKAVPHHLRYTDLTEHEITARRVILTHMSADMFARPTLYETARDGMAITI